MLDLNERRNINIRQLIIHKQVINKEWIDLDVDLSSIFELLRPDSQFFEHILYEAS